MKKVLVMLMSLVMVLSLATTAFAAWGSPSSGTSDDVNNGELDVEPDPEPAPKPTPKPTPTTPTPSEPVEEVKVEVKVEAAVDAGGNTVEVKIDTVDLTALAAEQPAVAEKIEETKAAVAEIAAAATPEQKEEAVTAYLEKQGEEVLAAITAAIAESAEVSSLADIEPVVVAPVKVESAAFEEGKSVTMTIEVPAEFAAYSLTENSFVCAQLVDANGKTHVVTFKVVNGKLVGDFPAAGVIGNFWVGSSVTAPKTGNTNLEGMVICGIVLCAAVLLFSVKRYNRA